MIDLPQRALHHWNSTTAHATYYEGVASERTCRYFVRAVSSQPLRGKPIAFSGAFFGHGHNLDRRTENCQVQRSSAKRAHRDGRA